MRALFVQPENGGHATQSGAVHRQLHPVFYRCVFGLAGAPDVTGFHCVRCEHAALVVHHFHFAIGRNFKRFVVRAVFFRFLRHQAHIRHGAHGGGVERAVFFAEIDGGTVNARIAAVGNHGFGIARLAVFVPHPAGIANHGGHGRIHNHIAGYMQVGNAFVGIHHRQIGILRIRFGNRFFHASAGGGIQFVQIGQQVAEAVVHIHAGGRQLFAVLLEHGGEKHFHGMAENNRVGHFHHGRLHVQREQHALFFRIFHLLLQELHQGFFAQNGGIDDFARFQRQRFAQFGGFAGFVGVDDSDGGRFGYSNGLFVMEKIAALHGGDV